MDETYTRPEGAPSGYRRKPDIDADPWRCSWTDGRERCHFPGAISHGTRGEGPWLCRFHFFSKSGADGQQVVEWSRGFRPGDSIVFVEQEEPGSGG